ncbi:hypothetical protein [Streptomyces sp. JJ36]|uniref:hypothetical protein n=1 Tax=Streptomyces sp. JJ36 TaxID=2736645 RepID=UPI001F1750F8|nr:hypothetical protein [Streptomyces sp. JJ36]MCF6523966.1 hypothetical protein [Streptomyces sp. JJ36]
MLVETLTQDAPALDAQLLEDLTVRPEAPVSGAPLPSPATAWLLILSPREPKEPKEPRRR